MIAFTAAKSQKLSRAAAANFPPVPYGAVMRLLREKAVKVNGFRVKEDVTLSKGDVVEMYYDPPEIKPYGTIYADDNVVVIDKKRGCSSENVYDALKTEYPAAKFIHRLDTNTSGLMIFALTEEAEKELLSGFKNRAFDKKYIAAVKGVMPKKSEVLTAYLVKDPVKSQVKIYPSPVKNSVMIKTGYTTLKTENGVSLIEVTLYTGKTHQIRAHLAYTGHPVVGDGKYGDNAFNRARGAKKQLLTAVSIKLRFDKNSALEYLNDKTFRTEADFKV